MTTVPTWPRRSSKSSPVRKRLTETSSRSATVSFTRISEFILSKYKAGYQSWKVFVLTNNPRPQNRSGALRGRQRKAQFIYLAETIVAEMCGIFGSGSGKFKSLAQHTHAGQRDAQGRSEDPRLVSS